MNVGTVSSWSAEAAGGARGPRGRGPMSDDVISALAEKLGVSADDLKSRLESADDPRKVLDQLAEEQGVSKQELRETIRSARAAAHGEAGPPPPPPPGGGQRAISFEDEVGQKLLSALAEKLEISADDLQAKLDAGADLGELLDEKGVSHEDVRAALKEAFKSWQAYGASGNATGAYSPDVNAVDVQL
jgi:uncharacterized protein YidB (DUF937 family)